MTRNLPTVEMHPQRWGAPDAATVLPDSALGLVDLAFGLQDRPAVTGATPLPVALDDALAGVEEEFDLVEYRESVGPLLAALPDRERRILLLRFFGGLTQTEIGAKVGLSQMHVSRLLNRTLEQLRHSLSEVG